VHPLLEALFRALDRDGVTWSLLRGESRLDGGGGDVDLLVGRADLGRLGGIVERVGFAHLPARGYASHAFFLAYDAPTGRGLKLDVVTELAFGPFFSLRTNAAAGCLRRRVRTGTCAVYRLADEDAFWALALHCSLDKREVSTEDGTRLRELASAGRTTGPLVRSLGRVSPPGWRADRIVEAVERGDWPGLVRLGDELATAWRRWRPSAWARMMTGWMIRRADTLRRLIRPRGLVVALVGPEALTGQLVEGIGSSSHLPVRSFSAGDVPGVFRIRRLRGAGLVLIAAPTLDEMPTLRRRPSRRRMRAWLEALSTPRPDLIIRLHPGPSSGDGDESGPRPSPSGVQVVDVAGLPDELRRAVSTMIWRRLVVRWTGRDARPTNHL
jgi:hypothetical protein